MTLAQQAQIPALEDDAPTLIVIVDIEYYAQVVTKMRMVLDESVRLKIMQVGGTLSQGQSSIYCR